MGRNGDILHFSVYDYDDTKTAEGDDGDDLLGKVLLSQEDFGEPGPRAYLLEDTGKDADARVELEVDIAVCTAFPELLGLDTELAKKILRKERRDLMPEVFELPTDRFSVTSWDGVHTQNGYVGEFFGALETDIVKAGLKKGDKIAIANKRGKDKKTYTYSHVAGNRSKRETIKGGALVRYVHIVGDLGEIGDCVVDGMLWWKEVEIPSIEFVADRVCLYVDPGGSKIAMIPRNG